MTTSTIDQRAYRSRRAILVFVLVAAAGLAADLVSNQLAFSRLLDADDELPRKVQTVRETLVEYLGEEPQSKDILHGLNLHRNVAAGVKLTLSTNPGVVFGILLPRAAVMAATVFISAFVVFLFASSPAAHRITHMAAALILAGALGNAYDRLFSAIALPGVDPIRNQVRDFLDFSACGYPWVFNVADVLLVVGVAMMVLQSFRHRPPAKTDDGGK